MPLAAYMVNFHFDSRTAITFVLAGQPELRELLKYAAFAALRQRIRISYHMPPMTLQETCSYIDHHTARCGRPASIFADDAKADIHRHAAGVPRLVNALCYRSILHAAANDIRAPSSRHRFLALPRHQPQARRGNANRRGLASPAGWKQRGT